MEVFVLNKEAFNRLMLNSNIDNENVEGINDHFFISINDSSINKTYFENKRNVKVLFFDDVEEDIVHSKGTAKAFTEEQAEELFDFIQKNKDKKICYVHCSAGISRSGAVGTFVNDYYGGDYYQFKKRHPHIHPNGLVLALLKREERKYYENNQNISDGNNN